MKGARTMDEGKETLKKNAANLGGLIGAIIGNGIAGSLTVPTSSFLALSLGGVMLGTAVLAGGGGLVGGYLFYKGAKILLDNNKKEES
jgi:hypothetical protein